MKFYSLIAVLLTALAHAQDPQADPAQAPLQADPAEDYFVRAKQLYETARNAPQAPERTQAYRRAIPILKDYIKQYPNHKNTQAAYYFLAESYYESRMPNQAKPIFQLIIDRYKTGRFVSAAAYRLAYDHYSQKRYAPAAKLFAITAKNAPRKEDQLRADYFQAQCYLLLSDIKAARPILARVAETEIPSPYRDQAYLTLGHILLREKKHEEALAYFQKLITGQQGALMKAEAAFHGGLAAAALDKNSLAESLYKITLETPDSPWIPKAHIALLGLHYETEDYQAVLARVKANKTRLDQDLLGQQGIIVGRTYYKLKNYTNAISYFNDVEKSMPRTQEAFSAGYYKLLCFYNLESRHLPTQVDTFITNYGVGNGTHKFIHQALLIKAESLFSQKKFKSAAKTYNAIDPKLIDEKNLPSLFYKKGWCLSEIGNHAGAANAFTEFIKGFPDDERIYEARTMRGQSFMELDDRVNALQDFDAVIKARPESKLASKALQSSARIQRKSKEYKDMIDRYRRLLNTFPNLNYLAKSNANYWIGWGYFKLDEFVLAPPFLEKAIDLDKAKYGEPAIMIILLCKTQNRDYIGVKKAVEDATQLDLYSKIPLSVFRWLGSQAYNAGDFVDASRYLQSGVAKGVPRKTPLLIWRLLSKSQLQAGLYAEALKSVNNVLEAEEEDARIVDAKLDKARILIALERYGDAKLIAEEALDLRPVGKIKAGLLMAMGDIHLATDKFNEAAQNYVLIVSNFQDLDIHPRALHNLAIALEKSGKKQEASEYRQELKQQYPDFTAE